MGCAAKRAAAAGTGGSQGLRECRRAIIYLPREIEQRADLLGGPGRLPGGKAGRNKTTDLRGQSRCRKGELWLDSIVEIGEIDIKSYLRQIRLKFIRYFCYIPYTLLQ